MPVTEIIGKSAGDLTQQQEPIQNCVAKHPVVIPALSGHTAHGATVTRPLYDTDYGSRDFAIEDPEGNHWSFGTYSGHPR